MMIKKEGFWRITFDTNPDDCNLHCMMCEVHSFQNRKLKKEKMIEKDSVSRMPIDLIRKVLEEAKETSLVEIIPSTMGEPLLYQDFEEILVCCKKFGLKLNLTTNGTFPKKGAEEWARLIVPVASDVKISWNGASKQTQENIMIGSSFEQGLENIKKFIKVRDRLTGNRDSYCTMTLQLTFMENNIQELLDIVKMAIALGIDRVKGHHLWTHFEELKALSMRRNKAAITQWNETIALIKEYVQSHPLAHGAIIKLENFDRLDEEAQINLPKEWECPFLGKEAWIAPDGHFNPCCAPDARRKMLGDFGNVYNNSILEIWSSRQYQELCHHYRQYQVCQECHMRRPNSKE